MRIGHHELTILGILLEGGGRVSFYAIKEKLSGYGNLKFRKMGFDRFHEVNIKHKALVRATKTLEEKGLINRTGYVSYWGKLSRIRWLELTPEGKMAYLLRT